MKHLLYITALLLLISCEDHQEEALLNCKPLPENDSIPLEEMLGHFDSSGLIRISEVVEIEGKEFNYSVYLPSQFDTVFMQSYARCTYSGERKVFTDSRYLIESAQGEIRKYDIDDSLFYVSLEIDTTSVKEIDAAYKRKQDLQRTSARKAAKSDTPVQSELLDLNGNSVLINETSHTEDYSLIQLDLISNHVIFRMQAVYKGSMATGKLDILREIVKSFKVIKR